MQKIMFNDRYKLTEAVLDGRKSMTRRLMPEPETGLQVRLNYDNTVGFNNGNGWYLAPRQFQPKFHVGETIAIAQAYKDLNWPKYAVTNVDMEKTMAEIVNSKGWNNKMFVRADRMPWRLKITGIKLERLQAISWDDCLLEGVQTVKTPNGTRYIGGGENVPCYEVDLVEVIKGKRVAFETPKEAFANLIDYVSRKGTWGSNPYVFAYSFKLICK